MEQIKHIDMQTPNGAELNLDALYKIAPSCFTEAKGDDGEVRHVIDFNKLRLLLGDNAVEDAPEVYDFTWVGKRAALQEAAAPINKTLRPCPEESVDWDTTQNLYIEGDNLEVLKLLQNSYMGKVKMIYIDPPYNTGNDFVYHDDFFDADYDEHNINEDGERFFSKTQVDVLGKLVKNTDSNGRFHSDWCSMIYSRLMVARNLLADDGALFLSIGDDEESNLIKICDEIFGEHNFIASICHKHRASVSNDRIISENHNHLIFYAKNISTLFSFQKQIGEDPILEGFKYKDEKGAYKLAPVDGPGGARKGNPYYEFLGIEGYWRYSKETMQKKYDEGLIVRTETSLQQKYYLEQAQKSRQTVTTWWDNDFLTSNATKELSKLLGGKFFDNPKSINLILRALKMITKFDTEAIILDFFSGSATTAHAVMNLNAEDGGNRKFIMVQLPEKTAEDSEAYKAGYKNICEIGKERIRRAGKKIKEENPLTTQDLDIGFRVFKCDSSNYKDVAFAPKDYTQGMLEGLLDNIKEDRTDLDLLFDCMLRWGVELSLPLSTTKVDGCTIHNVNDGDLVACFDGDVTEAVIDAIAKLAPLRVVFRDSSFNEAAQKMNLFELFKQKCDWTDEEVKNNVRVI